MIPRLNIGFPLKRQWEYWFGTAYVAREGEYLVNHERYEKIHKPCMYLLGVWGLKVYKILKKRGK